MFHLRAIDFERKIYCGGEDNKFAKNDMWKKSLSRNCLEGENLICFVTALSPPPFSPEWFLLNPVSLLAPARENGGKELAHAHSFCRCVDHGQSRPQSPRAFTVSGIEMPRTLG